MAQLDSGWAEEILQRLPIGVAVTDSAGRITWVNRRLCELLEVASETLTGLDPGAEQPPQVRALRSDLDLVELPAGGGHPGRRLAATYAHIEGAGGGPVRVACYQPVPGADEPKLGFAELEPAHLRAALTDHTTGLPNEPALLRALEPMVSRSRRYNNPLSVLAIRIEGPAAEPGWSGTLDAELVVAVAQLLRDQTRWADLVARLDEQDFVCVLQETEQADADKLLGKIREQVHALGEQRAPGAGRFSVRYGLAAWRKGDDARTLLTRGRAACDQSEADVHG